ncbi:MAG: MarR family winged helix-turn-helix transcriptional regulator [Candidatus Fimenecus sp.]
MPDTVSKEVGDMLTELIFQFYSALHRHPSSMSGPKIHTHGFHILYLLERAHDKRLPMSFLLTELQMTKQQMSKLINELEELDFIERVRTGRDRRNVFIRLTKRGSDYFMTCAAAVSDSIAEAFQKQPLEKTELVHSLLLQLMGKK